MANGHTPRSNRERIISRRLLAMGPTEAAGAAETYVEFVPNYRLPAPRSALEVAPLEASAAALTSAKLALPEGVSLEDVARDRQTLYQAGSLLPVGTLESVIGQDDRTLIAAALRSPWTGVCALRIQAATGQSLVGTGWLIDPKTVVTAGHCVYDDRIGGWVTRVEVIPALDNDARPFGSRMSTRFHAVDGWINDMSPEYDYGVIVLDQPFSPAPYLFEPRALSDAELTEQWVNIAGYPADRDMARRMYFHARKASSTAAHRIYYQHDTYSGQSGSPAWMNFGNGKRYVVGIHTNGLGRSLLFNSGTRITAEVLANIERWRTEPTVTPKPVVPPKPETLTVSPELQKPTEAPILPPTGAEAVPGGVTLVCYPAPTPTAPAAPAPKPEVAPEAPAATMPEVVPEAPAAAQPEVVPEAPAAPMPEVVPEAAGAGAPEAGVIVVRAPGAAPMPTPPSAPTEAAPAPAAAPRIAGTVRRLPGLFPTPAPAPRPEAGEAGEVAMPPRAEERPLTITGVVLDAAGRPMPDATVAISSGDHAYPEIAAISGIDGSFSLPVNKSGRYVVSAFTADRRANANVTVSAGQTGSVKITMPSA